MLTYRVAASLGYSRRERTRLCHRVIAAPASVGMEHSARDVPGWADAVLHDAVLLDELTLLPARQGRTAADPSVLVADTRVVLRPVVDHLDLR
jgi:hypothetical protein